MPESRVKSWIADAHCGGRILRSQLFQQAGSFAQRMNQSSIQWSASPLAAKEGD